MEQLQIKTYSRIEIAEITGKNPKGSHFARDVQTILSNWGYTFRYSRYGVEILKCPETPEERLAEILIRKLNIDIQIDPKAFALFLFAFQDIEQFDSMPWNERADVLYFEYDVKVDERTLRNWCKKLEKKGIISKSKRQSFWKTQMLNGYKNRFSVDPEAEEVKLYYEEQKKIQDAYIIEHINDYPDTNQLLRDARSAAVQAMWQKYQRCYYFCGGLNLTAFSPDEDDYLTEIYKLVDEIVFHRVFQPKHLQPNLSGKEEFDAQW